MKNYKHYRLGVLLGLTLFCSSQLVALNSLKLTTPEDPVVTHSILSPGFFSNSKESNILEESDISSDEAEKNTEPREFVEESKVRALIKKHKKKASDTLRSAIYDWKEQGYGYLPEEKNRKQQHKLFKNDYDQRLTRIAHQETLNEKSLQDIEKIFAQENLKISNFVAGYRGYKKDVRHMAHKRGLNAAVRNLKDLSFHDFQKISEDDALRFKVLRFKESKPSYLPLSQLNFYRKSSIVNRALNRAQKEGLIPSYSNVLVTVFTIKRLREKLLSPRVQNYIEEAQKSFYTPEQVEEDLEDRMLNKIERYFSKHDESYFEQKMEEKSRFFITTPR
jgi:hypothetical protein